MKWFKHLATARNDERISRLEDRAGLEGYGFYFKMLEIVAEVIDATDRHEVTYSLSRWGRQANITTKKFLFLSQCCADVGLMLLQRDGDDMSVKIPNLLKYRDNHTKNLQATSKQEVDKEEDKEIDKDKEEQEEKASPANRATRKRKTTIPDRFEISSRVSEWAASKGYGRLAEHLESFVSKARAKGYTYIDWDQAFMNAIRDDWAGLNKPPPAGNESYEAKKTRERKEWYDQISGRAGGNTIDGTAERVEVG